VVQLHEKLSWFKTPLSPQQGATLDT
jgi:hypothetical protein